MPKVSWWNTTHCEFWLHFLSPSKKPERKLSYIWLHYKKSNWCLGSHYHVRSKHTYCTQAGSGLLGSGAGLDLLFFRQAICKHQERIKRTQTYLCVFIMNKAISTTKNIFCICKNKWKLHLLKPEYNLFLPHSSVTNFNVSSFLKLDPMKPNLYGGAKYNRSDFSTYQPLWVCRPLVSVRAQ